MIRENGADPFAYTSGLQYRYPWVQCSVTLADGDGNQLKDNQDGYKIAVTDSRNVDKINDNRLMFWGTPYSHWFSSIENIKKFNYFIARTWWPPRESEPECILTREQWNLYYKPDKKFKHYR